MRLHRLSMTAFGPFAGTEVVDFDALGDAGLFLLHGPTGAGKTSVLDAVCYALYGQLPGARGGGRARLRSDHAPLDRCPQVQLDLTVAGRRIEVTRSPEWVRPKKRGAGVTTAPAATTVRELTGGQWHPLTTRSDEAGQLLLDLLGMGHEQFTKVVLLPQGDFAAFLRADAEQRRALLSRLFDIDRFAGVEAWLTDERRRLSARLEAGVQHARALLARAAEAFAGLPDTDDVDGLPEVTQGETKPAQWVARLLERAESIGRTAQVDLEVQTERANRAHAVLAEATALQARRVRWARASDQLACLDATRAAHDEAGVLVARARRAAPVSGLLETMVAASDEAAKAASVVQVARSAVPATAVALNQVGLRAAVTSHRLALGSLHDAAQRITDLGAVDARILNKNTQRREAEEAASRAQVDAARAAGDLERATMAANESALASADLAAAAQSLEAAATVVKLVRELGGVDDQVAAATATCSATIDADLEARERHLHLWGRRLADIAGELGAELVDGEACRVCGSAEHPAPAELAEDHVGRDAVDDAARIADQARAMREASERHLADLVACRARLATASQGMDEVSAAEALAAASHRVATAREAAVSGREAAAAATQARRQVEVATAEQRRWADVATASATTLTELTERRRQLHTELDRLRGDDADVIARRERLERETAAMDLLVDALGAAAAAERLVLEHRQRLSAACSRCGFDDEAEAAAAVLAPAMLEQLATAVDQHERRRGDLLALLDDPELRGIGGLPQPQVEQTRADVQRCDYELSAARSRATLAHVGVRRLVELARSVAAHEESLTPARDELDRVDALTACVLGTGGDNQLRMRLSSYVLAARLEEVAAAATERLAGMSDGRYALVHTDERAKGTGRSGLGLRVVDAWTGVERDTATLSGGESFLASLALALGLADVVQAEAAGSAIETLFIDEGFGTLDDETLEEVMTVLDGLRDGGRAVGLVSHVADLRTRIPTQLEVRKSRSGSTLVLHTSALNGSSG